MYCKWIIALAFLTTGAAVAFAQDKIQKEGQLPNDTVDLRLREGLEQYLEKGSRQKHVPDREAWDRFAEERPYMPYKNLRSTDPMPMMVIDDSTHYSLRIKKYPNIYQPQKTDPEQFNKYRPDIDP